MKETPEQRERRQQRERSFALLTREEQGIKIQRSWAHEFWLLRRRERIRMIILAGLVGVTTWHILGV